MRRHNQHADGGEIAQRIPAEVGKHGRVAHMEHGVSNQQVVAVWCRLGHKAGGYVATGARFVVNDHGLTQSLGHWGHNHAGHSIKNASRGNRHDQVDWPVGETCLTLGSARYKLQTQRHDKP